MCTWSVVGSVKKICFPRTFFCSQWSAKPGSAPGGLCLYPGTRSGLSALGKKSSNTQPRFTEVKQGCETCSAHLKAEKFIPVTLDTMWWTVQMGIMVHTFRPPLISDLNVWLNVYVVKLVHHTSYLYILKLNFSCFQAHSLHLKMTHGVNKVHPWPWKWCPKGRAEVEWRLGYLPLWHPDKWWKTDGWMGFNVQWDLKM